jgi:hypothetical protein
MNYRKIMALLCWSKQVRSYWNGQNNDFRDATDARDAEVLTFVRRNYSPVRSNYWSRAGSRQLRHTPKGDARAPTRRIPSSLRLYRRYEAETLALLEDPSLWSKIELVAAELVALGEISATQAHRLAGYPDPRLPAPIW